MPAHTVLTVGSPGLPLAALTATLRMVPRLNVVGPATDEATLSQGIPSDRLDLVLAEWEPQRSRLPRVVEAIRCGHLFPAIVLVGQEVDLYELAAMRALGITGYRSWSDLDPTTVRSAVRAALHGYFVLGPHVTGLSPRALLPQTLPDSPAPLLTDRERAVLRRLPDGMSEQQIAEAERTSTRTVKRTVMALKTRLDVASLSALAIRAERLNLTSSASHGPSG